ncbi:MAG: hypothetical protein EOM20_15295 [Spartobacteria bacterium]|nr:hypothetical protein [Spartobacteria bacterium]
MSDAAQFSAVPSAGFYRTLLVFFTLSLQVEARFGDEATLTDPIPPATTIQAENMRKTVSLLQPYLTSNGDGSMTYERNTREKSKLRSLSLSTAQVRSVANLYSREPSRTWLDRLPVLGVEISERDTSDAYQLNAVKLGFLEGRLWIVFEPLQEAGESISLRWQRYW